MRFAAGENLPAWADAHIKECHGCRGLLDGLRPDPEFEEELVEELREADEVRQMVATLALGRESAVSVRPSAAGNLAEGAQMSTPRVLIVDDSDEGNDIRRWLEEINFHVLDVVSDVDEAVRAIGSERPDVVLTDLLLPRLGYLDVIAAARRLPVEAGVVVLTTQDSTGVATQALGRGAREYLTRPLTGPLVRAVVRHAARLRQLDSELERVRALLPRLGTYA